MVVDGAWQTPTTRATEGGGKAATSGTVTSFSSRRQKHPGDVGWVVSGGWVGWRAVVGVRKKNQGQYLLFSFWSSVGRDIYDTCCHGVQGPPISKTLRIVMIQSPCATTASHVRVHLSLSRSAVVFKTFQKPQTYSKAVVVTIVLLA